jgi:hypothetical protein
MHDKVIYPKQPDQVAADRPVEAADTNPLEAALSAFEAKIVNDDLFRRAVSHMNHSLRYRRLVASWNKVQAI